MWYFLKTWALLGFKGDIVLVEKHMIELVC